MADAEMEEFLRFQKEMKALEAAAPATDEAAASDSASKDEKPASGASEKKTVYQSVIMKPPVKSSAVIVKAPQPAGVTPRPAGYVQPATHSSSSYQYGSSAGSSSYGYQSSGHSSASSGYHQPQQTQGRSSYGTGANAIPVAAKLGGQQDKKRKFRAAGGKVWVDSSLDEWPEDDYRIFVGDLGNEVTDGILASTFDQYKSFAKAKVVRDKHNRKSKGYGFVSFLDPFEMLKALKEKNGKYCGNRPMKLRKSTWKDRNVKGGKKKTKKLIKNQVRWWSLSCTVDVAL